MILRSWQPEPDENWQPQEERAFDSAQSLNPSYLPSASLLQGVGRVIMCLYCPRRCADVECKLGAAHQKEQNGGFCFLKEVFDQKGENENKEINVRKMF